MIDITNTYLSEAISHSNGIDLPSITFCLRRDHVWDEKNFQKIKR
jgi:hypothetical protein